MTYSDLKLVINDAYSAFTSKYVYNTVVGKDNAYPKRTMYFIKAIYKVLLNQNGNTSTDLLTKEEIQGCITLFNIMSNSTVPIEYT